MIFSQKSKKHQADKRTLRSDTNDEKLIRTKQGEEKKKLIKLYVGGNAI